MAEGKEEASESGTPSLLKCQAQPSRSFGNRVKQWGLFNLRCVWLLDGVEGVNFTVYCQWTNADNSTPRLFSAGLFKISSPPFLYFKDTSRLFSFSQNTAVSLNEGICTIISKQKDNSCIGNFSVLYTLLKFFFKFLQQC